MRLPPTPIGLPQPSLHALELPNYGDVPLAFELELDDMHALNEQSHGFPILQVRVRVRVRVRVGVGVS